MPVAPDVTPGDTEEPEPVDTDGDGLDDETEFRLGTNPFAADTDGDGLDDGDEVGRGTNPLEPDTDGDRLDDGDEVELGTDPLEPDTDGDRYLDGWEVVEGTDPKDPKSRINEGGWPYNPDKAALDDPGFSGALKKGAQMWNHIAVDQFEEKVHLYDFLGQGKDVFIYATSPDWCPGCTGYADWLSSGGLVDPFNMEASYGRRGSPSNEAIHPG